MSGSSAYNPEKQTKAIKSLIRLAKERRGGEISSEYFCRKVMRLEADRYVVLGNTFLSDIADLADDLDQADVYRYHNYMTREEVLLILENIDKLYST